MKTGQTVPEAALDGHIAILGKTGSGKTFAAKGIVEALLRQQRQVCVLDPTGAWWGLRLAADGKAKGCDVFLFGGRHGDLPLTATSGAAFARLVTQQAANVVLDTSAMSVGEYTRWFIDFAGTLYTTVRNPMHLVIDEAHHFMPEAGRGGLKTHGDAPKMLHAGNRLMSGGRALGIRGMLITQRPAKLAKDSLTCADTLIAMRVLAPQDRAAIKAWIDGCGDPAVGNEVLGSLAGMKVGEAWVWYPEGQHLQRTRFGKIATYDSSATPKHGARRDVEVRPVDLSEVRSALEEQIREAEANDPARLRREIADLKRELASKAPATDEAAIKRGYDDGYADGAGLVRGLYEAVESRTREAIDAAVLAANGIESAVGRIIGEFSAFNMVMDEQIAAPACAVLGTADRPPAVKKVRADIPIPIRRAPAGSAVPPVCVPRTGRSDENGSLDRYQRALLAVLVDRSPVPTSRGQLGTLAGKSIRSSAFNPRLRSLVHAGYAHPVAGGFVATDVGRTALGVGYVSVPTSGPDALAHWLGKLPAYESSLLRTIADARMPLSAEEVAERSGRSLSSSAFRPALRNLRKLELVEQATGGRYGLAEQLR
ncbi:MAG: DUF87 domain-containing protein [Candidatus Nanopelagicales bacterium]|nr:DUF87 domain-containing protein [Candidatus Nanopelagicales bacterium]